MKDKKLLKVTDIDGTTTYIEININIYNDYQRSIWREEYQDKKSDKEIRYDGLNEKLIPSELHSPSSEELYLKKLKYEVLYKAIEQLPKIQKRRLVLRYFHDLTFKEISMIENAKITSVQSSINAALEKLKKLSKSFFENRP